VSDQYRGDGIAARGIGYGMATIRVDGNDVLAVHNATAKARAHALETPGPVLIEAMTYRVGHHSTSDDSSAYRSKSEVEDWKTRDNPVVRFRKYMESKNWWSQAEEDLHKNAIKKELLEAFTQAEKVPKPALRHLFTDVYDELTPQLKEQEAELHRILKAYPEHYPTATYAKE
jgi:2-oxoisovalerate dehydrogenase E1 component alpha subunit